jgi:superfamily II DNA or RNA helicase
LAAPAPLDAATTPPHPFAAPAHRLVDSLGCLGLEQGPRSDGTLVLRLPSRGGRPLPSPTIAHGLGLTAGGNGDAEPVVLAPFAVPTVTAGPAAAGALLETLDERGGGDIDASGVLVGPSVVFLASAARVVRHLLAQQRFVPSLLQDALGRTRGIWQVWLADGPTAEKVASLMAAMPASCRAAVDSFGHDGWSMLHDFLLRIGDAECRRALAAESLLDALQGRDTVGDPHAAWLAGLLGAGDAVPISASSRDDLARRVHRWLGTLEDRGASSQWRLHLRLVEPVDLGALADLEAPGDDVRWTLLLGLQSAQAPGAVIDAADLWLLPPGAVTVHGQRLESPQDALLAELGRAARLYRRLEEVLQEAQPSALELTTAEAYRFLREVRPILLEQGFGAEAPAWWDQPTVRLGARLRVESEDIDSGGSPARTPGPGAAAPRLGLKSLVSYTWQLTIGDAALTLEQFQRLAAQHSPMVRLAGRWVEVRPEDVRAAMDFLRRNPGGRMAVNRLLRLAYAADTRETGLPIMGMDATGWVRSLFGADGPSEAMPILATPATFVGSLRPYQVKGLSWLAFLDRFGLGACLADDMGLGKTIQLLALLAHERSPDGTEAAPGPTLLVVPTSVVGNWVREARRFTPHLRVLVHHGMDRLAGEALARASAAADVVITTYALAYRDREDLSKIGWSRVALDEAQNIKNPAAKQTQAIRSIPADRRVALTGTPVENRLGELWSIMDFLNPGYLGTPAEFRARFALPIERYHDHRRGERLRSLVRPFVLRRLKTDPAVIADLPEKIETREFCFLTPEQATLYRTCVADMLSLAEQSEGIRRRGIVLAGLIRLKQICNHPALFFKEAVEGAAAATIRTDRSGKCQRLVEMLGEALDAGDRALVFTQFRQMGAILAAILRRDLDREVLFLHGGTPTARRDEMIARFQSGDPACPVFILSLRAGGLGLNLTAANHVFHFDRWWNPAVESQATDRAHRIGQTRSVQVHKFIVSGTLEERIDQMIEEKTSLAELVIGSGERWLTELSTSQLRDMLTLRADAVGEGPQAPDDLSRPLLPPLAQTALEDEEVGA